MVTGLGKLSHSALPFDVRLKHAVIDYVTKSSILCHQNTILRSLKCNGPPNISVWSLGHLKEQTFIQRFMPELATVVCS